MQKPVAAIAVVVLSLFLVGVRLARAEAITFASFSTDGFLGSGVIFDNATKALVTPAEGIPIVFAQLLPSPYVASAVFQMSPLVPVALTDPVTYGAPPIPGGPSAFGITLLHPTLGPIPWLKGTFDIAFFGSAGGFSLLFNPDLTVLEGPSLLLPGLVNPGRFVIAFGSPIPLTTLPGDLYELPIASAEIAAQVPEPGTLLLVTTGLAAACRRRRRGARR